MSVHRQLHSSTSITKHVRIKPHHRVSASASVAAFLNFYNEARSYTSMYCVSASAAALLYFYNEARSCKSTSLCRHHIYPHHWVSESSWRGGCAFFTPYNHLIMRAFRSTIDVAGPPDLSRRVRDISGSLRESSL